MDVPLFSDMWPRRKTACADGEILHVGDDLTTDVAAIRCGMVFAGLKPENADLMRTDSRLLPHIEISRPALLTSLI